jgi:hypothetical protein
MTNIPDITSLRDSLAGVRANRDLCKRSVDNFKKEVKELQNDQDLLDLVISLFQSLVDREVSAGIEAVEKLQTEGLRAVFDDQDLSLKTEVDIQRGKVSVNLITSQKDAQGNVTEGSSSDSFGGAVATVQSVLLRLTLMLRRNLRPLLIMDETLPAFDGNYTANMGKFLSTLCSNLGVDILLVSHNPAMVELANSSYKIAKLDNQAKFERIR